MKKVSKRIITPRVVETFQPALPRDRKPILSLDVEDDESTYLMLTNIGQFLTNRFEWRCFYAWTVAKSIQTEQKVNRKLLLSQLKKNDPQYRWTNVLDQKEIPFFKSANSNDWLYYEKQEKWIEYLMKRNSTYHLVVPRQIRKVSELKNYNMFIYSHIRACAENPVRIPEKLYKGAMGKIENNALKKYVPGRGLKILSKHTGLNINYITNVLSKYEGGTDRHTIERYTVDNSFKTKDEALSHCFYLNQQMQEGIAFVGVSRTDHKYEVRIKLSNGYIFTGIRFARTLNFNCATRTSSHDDIADTPSTMTSKTSIVSKKIKLKARHALSRLNQIIGDSRLKVKRIEKFHSKNVNLMKQFTIDNKCTQFTDIGAELFTQIIYPVNKDPILMGGT